jgi:hypothetical protein
MAKATSHESRTRSSPPKTEGSPLPTREVTYLIWSKDGLLRRPVFVGLREDEPARESAAQLTPSPKGGGRRYVDILVPPFEPEHWDFFGKALEPPLPERHEPSGALATKLAHEPRHHDAVGLRFGA